MRKLFSKRPSPAMVVAMIALIAAAGGTAYAAAITYKNLDKDARNKVLPIGKAKTTSECDPIDTNYVDCGSVTLKQSEQFPRKTMIVVDGTFSTNATSSRGECRIEVDGALVNNAFAKLGDNQGYHVPDFHAGWGLNTITAPLGGSHTYSVKCNEQAGGIKFHDIQISAIGIRG
jgi:hypothetical protein